MKRPYVVTEGKVDAQILRAVLPENVTANVEFVVGSGRYSMQSLARSILAVRQLPVAVVIDADTDDKIAIQEQLEFVRGALRQASAGAAFEVFFAVPEIESLLFQDRSFIEEFANQSFSDTEWEITKSRPKQTLAAILERKNSSLQQMLSQLTENTIEVIRKHPPVNELLRFLSSLIMVDWFFEHYENPAHGVPYESREGGYQYVFGGPYDAREELQESFPYAAPEDIEEAVEAIERESLEWVKKGQYSA